MPLPDKRPPKAPRPTKAELQERTRIIGSQFEGKTLTVVQLARVRQIEQKIDAYTAWRLWPEMNRVRRQIERNEAELRKLVRSMTPEDRAEWVAMLDSVGKPF